MCTQGLCCKTEISSTAPLLKSGCACLSQDPVKSPTCPSRIRGLARLSMSKLTLCSSLILGVRLQDSLYMCPGSCWSGWRIADTYIHANIFVQGQKSAKSLSERIWSPKSAWWHWCSAWDSLIDGKTYYILVRVLVGGRSLALWFNFVKSFFILPLCPRFEERQMPKSEEDQERIQKV